MIITGPQVLMRNLQKHKPLQKKKTGAYQEWFRRTNKILPCGTHIGCYTQCRHRAGELEMRSQVAHTGFYTQCGTRLENGKKKANTHIGFYTQCGRAQRTIWGNSYQPLHSMKNTRPCFPMYSGWGISNQHSGLKRTTVLFRASFNSHTVTKNPRIAY